MISKIVIYGPASYKKPATLETNKNVNLIYGLNGTGKSTFSEYLRTLVAPEYENCSISPVLNEDEEILVYNEKYVHEIFYSSPTIKGIFSLSKENADAKRKIDEAQTAKKKLENQLATLKETREAEEQSYNTNKQTLIGQIWKIKSDYYNRGHVFEYCLLGLVGSKDSMFNYVVQLPMHSGVLGYTLDSLEKELMSLNRFRGSKIEYLKEYSQLHISAEDINLLKSVITGNPNSRVSDLIVKFQSADWVKQGLSYNSKDVCPFCQRSYDNSLILDELNAFFNEDYENAIKQLQQIKMRIEQYLSTMYDQSELFDSIDCIKDLKSSYISAFAEIRETLTTNILSVSEKIKTPSVPVQLRDVQPLLQKLNEVFSAANREIDTFNKKIANIDSQKAEIKTKFWQLIRVKYNNTVEAWNTLQKTEGKSKSACEEKQKSIKILIKSHEQIIEHEQTNVVNINEAILHINNMLLDMGITDFSIKKHSEDELYCLARGEEQIIDFKTLSEGERTIISFLYFVEMCKGVANREEQKKKRIIVIDDPVSSLSNVYIFNVGRIIKDVFLPQVIKVKDSESGYGFTPKFEQVFILTHSLYFFYEMTETKKEYRDVTQKLFRLYKSEEGSSFSDLTYESIQTDYQSYWMIVRDRHNHPALVANCMRNIVEYFFNFVEKRDLNNVFNTSAFKSNIKLQAFYRYINRESHSLGQNIYDYKEFNYDDFVEGLRLLFVLSGYEDHYNKMMHFKVVR